MGKLFNLSGLWVIPLYNGGDEKRASFLYVVFRIKQVKKSALSSTCQAGNRIVGCRHAQCRDLGSEPGSLVQIPPLPFSAVCHHAN